MLRLVGLRPIYFNCWGLGVGALLSPVAFISQGCGISISSLAGFDDCDNMALERSLLRGPPTLL